MKKYASCLILLTWVAGCHTVHTNLPDAHSITQPARQTLQTKKQKLQAKHAPVKLDDTLGGIVQSDEWIIYKDKEQEEFKGHVFYDNDQYIFKAQYALSDRKQHTITASGNVYLKEQLPQHPVYEVHTDWGRYNYQTGQGYLKSTSSRPVRLQLTEPTQTVTAHAKRIEFNTQTQTATLQGNVFTTRVTPQGTQTMHADKAIIKQLENYVYLSGHATLSDGLRTLQADTIIYNGAQNEARAFGARPLVTGSAEQGTFAIIADNVSSDAQGKVVTLDGRVQGWLVSPQVNENKLNEKF